MATKRRGRNSKACVRACHALSLTQPCRQILQRSLSFIRASTSTWSPSFSLRHSLSLALANSPSPDRHFLETSLLYRPPRQLSLPARMEVAEVGPVRCHLLWLPKRCRRSMSILRRAPGTSPPRKCASALGCFAISERLYICIRICVYVCMYVMLCVVCIWLAVEFRFRGCLGLRRLIFRYWSRRRCSLEKPARKLGTRLVFCTHWAQNFGGCFFT